MENNMDSETPSASEVISPKIKPQTNHPPNPTLYLSNIDWSIKKGLLKRSLLALFTRHGKVLDIICLRGAGGGGKPLRGQAWVIFDSLSAATNALQAEHGFIFFGRPLLVNYAKEVSDRIAKKDGTYGARAKEKRATKRRIEESKGNYGDSAGVLSLASGKPGVAASATDILGQSSPPPKAAQPAADLESAKKSCEAQASCVPSSILLAKNLPTDCNELMLAMLFKQYSGYKEVKLFEGAMGASTATIEFGSISEATSSLKALNGFKLTTSASLDLTYGER